MEPLTPGQSKAFIVCMQLLVARLQAHKRIRAAEGTQRPVLCWPPSTTPWIDTSMRLAVRFAHSTAHLWNRLV